MEEPKLRQATKKYTIPRVLEAWNKRNLEVREVDTAFLPEAVTSIPPFLRGPLKSLLQINELLDVLHQIPPGISAEGFAKKALEVMRVNFEIDPALQENLPKKGSVVIVSNHPFGGIDGLALMAALLPLRPDFKVLVNVILGIFADLRECCLPLDVLSGTSKAVALNTASLRSMDNHLANGGAVGFFPSGTVSYWQGVKKGIADPDWQMTAARLAKRHNASILPLFFHGRNSVLFNILGVIHPMLRTLMLPREFYRQRGKTIRLSAGRLIEPPMLKLLQSAEATTAYMRMRSYVLADDAFKEFEVAEKKLAEKPMEPVAEGYGQEVVAKAFAELPSECLLVREGDYTIYSIRGGQSSLLLEELGSLRESSFRLIGEGSGKARDLDMYDKKYHHLLLWHEKDRCLVGAYRLGKVQELLTEEGPSGLYTTTLFKMNNEFFRRYGNGLELGRAVVHPGYQREYAPLMLLWKGIGQFILRNEEIHCLFGPVSLSLDYAPASLKIALDYFLTQCGSSELSSMVKGRIRPKQFLKNGSFPLPDNLSYNGLVSLVKDIEGGRGIPVLFKHYLKLGGKIGAFHMDSSFNTLDAFLLMDLVYSPQSMLERYMTPDGAKTFLERWR